MPIGTPDIINIDQNPQVARAHIRSSIKAGTFTPFLGAGASSLRPTKLIDKPWDTVLERLYELRGSLKTQEEREYLESLAVAHNLSLGKHEVKPSATTDALFALQLALVRCGSHLVNVFGEGMSRSRMCVSELQNYQVPIRAIPTPERIHWIELLFQVADATQDLKKSELSESKPKLELENIYSKILLSVCRLGIWRFMDNCKGMHELNSKDDEEFGSLKGLVTRHESKLKYACADCNKKPLRYLRLDELAWLEDLLWHSLRFRVPAYPTSSELSFELSLATPGAEMRRGGLAEVAEQRGPEKALQCVTDLLTLCESQQPEVTELHLGVAKALWCQFNSYKRKRATLRSQGRMGTGLHWPMAFTTNYDRLIERALQKLGVPYHVVFPVSAKTATRTEIVWLFATFSRQNDWKPTEVEDCLGWQEDNLRHLAGPLIIKLHGSPQEDTNALQIYRDLKPNLVLSESSYLEAIVGRKKYPAWLDLELCERGRVLWFLGYSISDWNVRIRLYEHLSHLDGEQVGRDAITQVKVKDGDGATAGPTSKLAVDHDLDRLHSSILGTLDITVLEGELSNFATLLLQEIDGIPDCRPER